MSIIDTLITNRTQADADALLALYAKPKAMWTVDEWNEFLLGNHRGAYNASDMNRVLDALEYLAERVTEFGYVKPEIKRPSITEVIPGTSRLPEGYMELEYIESSGTQYIDTGFIPNQDTRVVLDVQMQAENDSLAANDVFGARTSASSKAYAVQWNTANNYFQHFYNNGYNNLDFGDFAARQVIDMDKNVLSIGGVSHERTYASFQGDYTLYLFALNGAGTAQFFSKMRVHSCQIYDNDTLIRDYVPCLNPSNEVGLYDMVNGLFYGNAGTGYFLPGPVVSLPEGYTRLEYVESSGSEYINTAFNPSQNTRIVMDILFPITNTGWLFGSRHANNVSAFGFVATSAPAYRDDFGTEQLSISTNVSNRFVLDKNKNITYFSGTEKFSHASETFQSNYPLYLFNLNSAGTANTGASAKIYLCLIYDDNVLSRLYTPVLNANGEIGLYDSITGAFFGNAGTGVFVAGNELGSSDGNIPTQIIERDYYAIGDRPPDSELRNYLDNVATIRSVFELPSGTPEVPEDISKRILIEEANNIEIVLTAVELLLNRISISWVYSGEFTAGEV